MTMRNITIIAVVLAVFSSFFACNSAYEYTYSNTSSTAVKDFSLSANKKLLNNLDSVFFSIDLNNGLIFNADSLPYGTDVTRLVPVITTLQTPSSVQLTVTKSDGSDTTYNYLTNSTDSIDFTNPVKLTVISYDGASKMNYTVKVNVHTIVSDSLSWDINARSTLPSTLSEPIAQRTAISNGKFYCLTADAQNNYSIATYTPNDNILNGPQLLPNDWTTDNISFPFTPQINSFAGTSDALYILSDDGSLFTSTDCSSWINTGVKWHYIYGAYGSEILGSVNNDGIWEIESYPSQTSQELLDGMPVEGTTMPISVTFHMSAQQQIVIIGGVCADGSLSRNTWGYDGKTWVNISKTPLAEPLKYSAATMYYSFQTSSSWAVTTYPTILLFGGVNNSGEISKTVYTSADYGYIWQKGASLVQLPSYIPGTYDSQVFVVDSYFSANASRVSQLTESWPCPYIYLFGGYDQNGNFQNAIWRGLINRLSFAPIE